MRHDPGLYGILHTNRKGKDLWGKNQFNSTFPASMACLMRDRGIPAIHVQLNDQLITECVEMPIDKLFNTTLPNAELYFDFESRYDPFEELNYGHLERVDLVIRKAIAGLNRKGEKTYSGGEAFRALEVKLTVVPDSATYKLSPNLWGPEMVIRPATMMYCALGMAAHQDIPQQAIKDIFMPIGMSVKDWSNEAEAISILPKSIEALDLFQKTFYTAQSPLIMQPIWKTEGRKPILDDDAFDIFVWSDFALARVFIDLAKKKTQGINRYSRAVLRLTRFLFEYGRAGEVNIGNIYSDMTYSHQSDKEASLNGSIMRTFLNHSRLLSPVLSRDSVRDIILGGGEKYLSPERRFDQTVYFTYNFEEELEATKGL